MRIPPIVPLVVIPPPPKKEPPEEPISFCGHLRKLMAIQQRHLMLQRMMCWWSRMTSLLGFSTQEGNKGFNKIV